MISATYPSISSALALMFSAISSCFSLAKERYQEVVDLVRFGKAKLNIFTEKEYYEGHIDPANGADWNQTAPIDTKPTLEDFKKTVSDYLAWEVSTLLKNQDNEDESLGK